MLIDFYGHLTSVYLLGTHCVIGSQFDSNIRTAVELFKSNDHDAGCKQ